MIDSLHLRIVFSKVCCQPDAGQMNTELDYLCTSCWSDGYRGGRRHAAPLGLQLSKSLQVLNKDTSWPFCILYVFAFFIGLPPNHCHWFALSVTQSHCSTVTVVVGEASKQKTFTDWDTIWLDFDPLHPLCYIVSTLGHFFGLGQFLSSQFYLKKCKNHTAKRSLKSFMSF